MHGRVKRSSLLGTLVNYDSEKFDNIGPWSKCLSAKWFSTKSHETFFHSLADRIVTWSCISTRDVL